MKEFLGVTVIGMLLAFLMGAFIYGEETLPARRVAAADRERDRLWNERPCVDRSFLIAQSGWQQEARCSNARHQMAVQFSSGSALVVCRCTR